jgi:hypothetical protein
VRYCARQGGICGGQSVTGLCASIAVFPYQCCSTDSTHVELIYCRKGKVIPGQTFRVLKSESLNGCQISRQSADESGKVSPTHRPPLPARKYSTHPFLLEAESTPGP